MKLMPVKKYKKALWLCEIRCENSGATKMKDKESHVTAANFPDNLHL